MFDNVIKWTGTKRSLAKEITSYFPQEIDTYREPFIGSGAILRSVLENTDIFVNHYIAGDICQPLISLWIAIQKHPLKLARAYSKYWLLLQKDNSIYYKIRDEFNFEGQKDPSKFLFLLRTCFNGLVRFNSDGYFNTSFHVTRKGINPDTLRAIIVEWSKLIQPVEFRCQDYTETISYTSQDDFVFLDPPYVTDAAIYASDFSHKRLFKIIKNLNCNLALTFNGFRDKKYQGSNSNKKQVENLFDKTVLLGEYQSSFNKLKQSRVQVRESLYLKGENYAIQQR